jgi:hypothetical protein
LATVEFSDTIEATITGMAYWLGPGCADPDCTITSDFLTSLNATHVLRCIYKSATNIVFYADLDITNPCEALCTMVGDGTITVDKSVKLWVWVEDIGGGNCQMYAQLGSNCNRCITRFESTSFLSPTSCEALTLSYASGDGNPGNYNCCLQASGATIALNFP